MQGVEFIRIECLEHRLRSTSLGEEVVAKATLTTGLECRSIGTEAHLVVLPGHVVQALGILTATSNDALLHRRRTRSQGVVGSRGGLHIGCKEQLLVVGQLIRQFVAICISQDQVIGLLQLQLLRDLFHRELHQFPLTVDGEVVAHANGEHLLRLRAGPKGQRSQQIA